MTDYAIILVTEGHEREVRRMLRKKPQFDGICGKFKLPIHKIRKPIRNVKSKKWREVNVIVFVGYVFAEIKFDYRWPEILDCPEVWGVLTNDRELPYKIEGEILDSFSRGLPDEPKKSKMWNFQPGQIVSIKDGILKGQIGKVLFKNVIEIGGKNKVQIPFEFLEVKLK